MSDPTLLTPEQIRNRINGLDAWVAHITASTDALHDLVHQIAVAGEEADKRIAELAVAQAKTEKTLESYLASITRTNGK